MRLLFSFLLIVAAMTASGQALQQKFERVTDTAEHYSILVPQGWRYLTQPEHGSFEAWRPDDPAKPEIGQEVASMIIMHLNFTLPELAETALADQIKSLNAVVKDSATVNFGGRQAFVALTYYTVPETGKAWQSVLILRIPEKGRCLMF
jgi:hypothetical protein